MIIKRNSIRESQILFLEGKCKQFYKENQKWETSSIINKTSGQLIRKQSNPNQHLLNNNKRKIKCEPTIIYKQDLLGSQCNILSRTNRRSTRSQRILVATTAMRLCNRVCRKMWFNVQKKMKNETPKSEILLQSMCIIFGLIE